MKTIIIGAGPAGVTVAETLRQNRMTDEIVMLSSEPFPPYAPPAMLEYFMTGQEAHLWKWGNITARLEPDYRSGTTVTEILPEQQKIRLNVG
jgi:NADPH-dependent 2,4-dienoyl-CoA reductase/sulfur reductase-like enzyme